MKHQPPPGETFDRIAHDYDRYAGGDLQVRLQNAVVETIAGFVRPPARVVDLGCGPGHHALALARRGYDVTAVDVSPRMIELVEQRSREEGIPVHAVVADVASAELPDAGYEVALSVSGPFSYTPSPEALAARVASLLAPNGRAFIGLPRAAFVPEMFRTPKDTILPFFRRGPSRRSAQLAGAALDVWLWDPRSFASVIAPWLTVLNVRGVALVPRLSDRLNWSLGGLPLFRRLGALSLITAERARGARPAPPS